MISDYFDLANLLEWSLTPTTGRHSQSLNVTETIETVVNVLIGSKSDQV